MEEASYVFGAGFVKTFFQGDTPSYIPGYCPRRTLSVCTEYQQLLLVPVMLGGGKVMVMTNMIYQQTMFIFDWNFAAALSVVLLFVSMFIVTLSSFLSNKMRIQE